MNKAQRKARKAWVKALRSGDYNQGREVLVEKTSKNKDKFCCLGVACDLAVKAGLLVRNENIYDSNFEWVETGFTMESELDETMLARLGLTFKQQSVLVQLNDEVKMSFGDIANVIEAFDSKDTTNTSWSWSNE